MGFIDWIKKTHEDIEDEGLYPGARYSLNQFYYGFLRRLSPLFPNGVNVYEKEWDLLIIIDGCRLDAMKEVAGEYDFLQNPGVHRSVGSTSIEWIRNTFTEEYADQMEKTIHVTANYHAEILSDNQFFEFERVYEYGWDEEAGTIPAGPVTDAAISLGREHKSEFERMVVHYYQPHFPSIPKPIGHGNKTDKNWSRLWRDGLDEELVWNSYIQNLRYVLDNLSVLLQNIDANNVVISTDHGNAKGEWGVYNHPRGVPISVLRDIPWYKTSASDGESYEPDLNKKKENYTEEQLQNQLEALGYRV